MLKQKSTIPPKKNCLKKCKDFYEYLLKTLHFENDKYAYPIDFKVVLCF